MEQWLDYAFRAAWGIVGVFDSHELIGWANILGACAFFAFLLLWRARRDEMRDAGGVILYLFPSHIWTHERVRLDTRYYLLIQALKMLLVAPLLAFAMYGLPEAGKAWLELQLGAHHPGGPEWLRRLAYTLVVFVAVDFAFFITHYWSHKWKWLWAFHKVHHSPHVLTPLTAQRFHPVDLAWNAGVGALLAGLAGAAAGYALLPDQGGLSLFGNNLVVAAAYLTTHIFRHSHIWIDYPRWLRWLISPAQHQLHHSRERRHIDVNMGYLLSCWDRMLGTLYIPQARETFCLGVYGMPKEGWLSHDSIASILAAPFVELLASRRQRLPQPA